MADSLGEWSTEGQELSRDDPVDIPVLDLVEEHVLFGIKGAHVDVVESIGSLNGASAVQNIQLVCADAESRVSERHEGRVYPCERCVCLLCSSSGA